MTRLQLARLFELLALGYLALILLSFGAGRIELGVFSFGGHATKIIPYLYALSLGAAWLRRERFTIDAPLLVPGLAFLAVALVGSVGSTFPYSALQTWMGLVAALAFYLYLCNLRLSRREIEFLWIAWLAGNLYLCIVAVWQDLAGERVHGTFNHFNMLASYVMLALPALLYGAAKSRGWRRHGMHALALVLLYLLFRTYSRAAILGVGAGVVLLCILTRGTAHRIAMIALAVMLALGVLMLSTLAGRFGEIRAELADPAPLSRVNLWKGTLQMIATHPERLVFGQGWGESFQHEMSQTRVGWMHPMLAERYTHAHNLYLHLLFAYGIAGLAAFLWMMAAWFGDGWTRRSGAEAFLLAGGVAFLVHACFEVLLTTFNLPLALFALLALSNRADAHRSR